MCDVRRIREELLKSIAGAPEEGLSALELTTKVAELCEEPLYEVQRVLRVLNQDGLITYTDRLRIRPVTDTDTSVTEWSDNGVVQWDRRARDAAKVIFAEHLHTNEHVLLNLWLIG